VKCDEGRPSCRRCVDTGRVCDSYGIWDSGDQTFHQVQFAIRPSSGGVVSGPFTALTTAERDSFEWFTHRTARKMSGIFRTPFWDLLVRQACLHDPAVLHAALALAFAHRSPGYFDIDNWGEGGVAGLPLSSRERLALRQYNVAIRKLSPHLSAGHKESVRIALVVCILFVCFDFLHGHYQTALIHIRSGIKLISVGDAIRTPGSSDMLVYSVDQSTTSSDVWLAEAFAGLNLQARLLGQTVPRLTVKEQHSATLRPTLQQFQSFTEARRSLDAVLHRILDLEEIGGPTGTSFHYSQRHQNLLEQKTRILEDLNTWDRAYQDSKPAMETQMARLGPVADHVLQSLRFMANIMASTCLRREEGEMAFDRHLPAFVAIVNHSTALVKYVHTTDLSHTSVSHTRDIPPFIPDMGSVAPLYYTILKCRSLRVRTHALGLLTCSTRREGLWDAHLTAAIARQVIEIEERGLESRRMKPSDSFVFGEMLKTEDVSAPTLPEACRIRKLRVRLPNGFAKPAALWWEQKCRDGTWKVLVEKGETFTW